MGGRKSLRTSQACGPSPRNSHFSRTVYINCLGETKKSKKWIWSNFEQELKRQPPKVIVREYLGLFPNSDSQQKHFYLLANGSGARLVFEKTSHKKLHLSHNFQGSANLYISKSVECDLFSINSRVMKQMCCNTNNALPDNWSSDPKFGNLIVNP